MCILKRLEKKHILYKTLFYLSISEFFFKYINMKLPQHWVNVSYLLGYTLHDTLTQCQEKSMFDIIFIPNITFLKPMAISCLKYN